jgi:hypothetical protein
MFELLVEIGLGLALVFLIFGLATSGLYELGARLFQTRAKSLWAALSRMVTPTDLVESKTEPANKVLGVPLKVGGARPGGTEVVAAAAQAATDEAPDSSMLLARLYAHPLVGGLERLAKGEKTKIDHITANGFSQALVGALVPGGDGTTSIEDLRESIAALDDTVPFKGPLLTIVSEAATSIAEFRDKAGKLFDEQMDQLSRLYKRRAKLIMFVIGLGIAFACNVDAVHVGQELVRNEDLRTATATAARGLADECKDEEGTALDTCLQTTVVKIDETLDLPVGWTEDRQWDDMKLGDGTLGLGDGPIWLAGWVLAAAALAQGGPFWFDIIKRLSTR